MKQLILVRHATARPAGLGDADFQRRLTPAGHAEAERSAEAVRKLVDAPSRFISSPAPRALATAQYFVRAFQRPDHALESEPRLYPGDPLEWLNLVQSLDDNCPRVMLVGHNPGVSLFASELLRRPMPVSLSTSEWVVLSLDTERWADCLGSGRLLARGHG